MIKNEPNQYSLTCEINAQFNSKLLWILQLGTLKRKNICTRWGVKFYLLSYGRSRSSDQRPATPRTLYKLFTIHINRLSLLRTWIRTSPVLLKPFGFPLYGRNTLLIGHQWRMDGIFAWLFAWDLIGWTVEVWNAFGMKLPRSTRQSPLETVYHGSKCTRSAWRICCFIISDSNTSLSIQAMKGFGIFQPNSNWRSFSGFPNMLKIT